MNKALVTGVAGFIGSHLADSLIDHGWRVFGIDNLLTGDKRNINSNVNFKFVDIRKKDSLNYYIKSVKPDYIFHLAAIARTPWTIDDPILCHETNISGTLNVLMAARDSKVKKVVFASSNIVYAEYTPYLVSKITGELYMRTFDKIYDLQTISLRFSNAYGSLRQSEKGPSINCIASLRQSKRENGYIWITGDGKQSRDFTHVLDIAQACELAANSNVHGKEIDICTGINHTMNNIAKYFNCKIKFVKERIGDVKHIKQDPKRAKKLFGFEAKRRLEDNIHVYTD
jgi:UDP-glucose 4-epimerase